MTFCVVQRDVRTLAVADANDPRVGVYVPRVDQRTFWDYHEACEHGRALAARNQLEFSIGSILNDRAQNEDA